MLEWVFQSATVHYVLSQSIVSHRDCTRRSLACNSHTLRQCSYIPTFPTNVITQWPKSRLAFASAPTLVVSVPSSTYLRILLQLSVCLTAMLRSRSTRQRRKPVTTWLVRTFIPNYVDSIQTKNAVLRDRMVRFEADIYNPLHDFNKSKPDKVRNDNAGRVIEWACM